MSQSSSDSGKESDQEQVENNIKYARVKLVLENQRKTVKIDEIQEFRSKIPKNSKDYNPMNLCTFEKKKGSPVLIVLLTSKLTFFNYLS